MATYRPKQRVFQAVPGFEVITAYARNPSTLPEWVQKAYEAGRIVAITSKSFTLKDEANSGADRRVDDQDWLAMEADGSLVVIGAEEFTKYFEAA